MTNAERQKFDYFTWWGDGSNPISETLAQTYAYLKGEPTGEIDYAEFSRLFPNSIRVTEDYLAQVRNAMMQA